ncbi:uncharacterized protein LOC113995764 [Pipra filicauda]|uniref:Uncharacterized protein LOC113995764 n=1 Tax=Pipra filicauda TaxID=649802 RepID=A0A7R5K9E7_9PASS|nr:uncharacterized protein LOC113995764 [Pipra filicauda]
MVSLTERRTSGPFGVPRSSLNTPGCGDTGPRSIPVTPGCEDMGNSELLTPWLWGHGGSQVVTHTLGIQVPAVQGEFRILFLWGSSWHKTSWEQHGAMCPLTCYGICGSIGFCEGNKNPKIIL